MWKKVTDDYNEKLGCLFTKAHVRQHFNSNIKGADKKKDWKNNDRLKKRLTKASKEKEFAQNLGKEELESIIDIQTFDVLFE